MQVRGGGGSTGQALSRVLASCGVQMFARMTEVVYWEYAIGLVQPSLPFANLIMSSFIHALVHFAITGKSPLLTLAIPSFGGIHLAVFMCEPRTKTSMFMMQPDWINLKTVTVVHQLASMRALARVKKPLR
jgi:hypothetical protein